MRSLLDVEDVRTPPAPSPPPRPPLFSCVFYLFIFCSFFSSVKLLKFPACFFRLRVYLFFLFSHFFFPTGTLCYFLFYCLFFLRRRSSSSSLPPPPPPPRAIFCFLVLLILSNFVLFFLFLFLFLFYVFLHVLLFCVFVRCSICLCSYYLVL